MFFDSLFLPCIKCSAGAGIIRCLALLKIVRSLRKQLEWRFARNATRAGSEEGRLFSQAKLYVNFSFGILNCITF